MTFASYALPASRFLRLILEICQSNDLASAGRGWHWGEISTNQSGINKPFPGGGIRLCHERQRFRQPPPIADFVWKRIIFVECAGRGISLRRARLCRLPSDDDRPSGIVIVMFEERKVNLLMVFFSRKWRYNR